MSEQSTPSEETTHEARMIKAIVHDMAIALPVALIGLTVALALFTESSWGEALTTALLPGALMGVFFGGFSGTARSMD